MKKFEGTIRTNIVGSDCEFEFEVEDNATEDDIDREAREAAFDLVEWEYREVEQCPGK